MGVREESNSYFAYSTKYFGFLSLKYGSLAVFLNVISFFSYENFFFHINFVLKGIQLTHTIVSSKPQGKASGELWGIHVYHFAP